MNDGFRGDGVSTFRGATRPGSEELWTIRRMLGVTPTPDRKRGLTPSPANRHLNCPERASRFFNGEPYHV